MMIKNIKIFAFLYNYNHSKTRKSFQLFCSVWKDVASIKSHFIKIFTSPSAARKKERWNVEAKTSIGGDFLSNLADYSIHHENIQTAS